MSSLQIRRRGYALGAEITGVDATKPIDPATVAAIKQAWLDNIVIYLPGQNLSPLQFRDFCGQLGQLDVENSTSSGSTSAANVIPEYPEVRIRANQQVNFNGMKLGKSSPADRWHSDYSHKECPTTVTFLLAKDMPAVGGDTMFANQYMAYETLSPAYQRLVEQLSTIRDYAAGAASYATSSPEQQANAKNMHPYVVHPAVKIHPETGRKLLYIDAFVTRFVGMTDEESKPIIDFLMDHATRYEFVYRHRWTVNDLVIWDNRCALHFAVQDYDQSELRRTFRASVTGPKTGYLYAGETNGASAQTPAMAMN